MPMSPGSLRKIDDLISDAIAARLQIIGPELKDLQSDAGQRLFPARFLLIDGTAIVGA